MHQAVRHLQLLKRESAGILLATSSVTPMHEALYSVLVGTAGLSLAALMALLLTVTRSVGDPDPLARRSLVRLIALAILLQSLHFTEELLTGFHMRFPEMLGLRPWSITFFVGFNLFWIAVWGGSLAGVHRQLRAALFPLWFLGIACAANGIAHPLFSVVERGYFPGLWSSPLVGIAGFLLLRGLAAFTRAERLSPGSA